MIMEEEEMRVFDLALQGLIEKARAAGSLLSPQEIARRMLLVQEAKVYDPAEFDQSVLSENFAKFERAKLAKLERTALVEIERILSDAKFDSAARRNLERT